MVRKKRVKTPGEAEEPTPKMKASAPAEAKPSPEPLPSTVSVQEKIALLAYSYWEERGRPDGSSEEDWLRAERDILGRLNVAER